MTTDCGHVVVNPLHEAGRQATMSLAVLISAAKTVDRCTHCGKRKEDHGLFSGTCFLKGRCGKTKFEAA